MRKTIFAFLTGFMMFGTITAASPSPDARNQTAKKPKVQTGIDMLFPEYKKRLKGKRIGLITNPTGVNASLKSSVDILYENHDIKLTALFGPEHGVRGDAQAGDEIGSYIDEKTGVPVYSLYGKTKKPTPEMLKDVDVLIFDIQDVGTRYYTYIYTMAYAMEAAKENGIPFMVLDRPNPQGGKHIEGPILEPEYASFIGLYPIPLKHGMTIGELALLFNKEFGIDADLTVVKMKQWKRKMDFDDTRLPFVLPSPNMPTVESTFVYPATGLIEGTNISEGRGTTKPFELIGAPFIKSTELEDTLNSLSLPGVTFRAASFTPTFSKHQGTLCHGVQLYVTNRETFEVVRTGLSLIKAIHDLYPDNFEFLSTGSFDKLAGNGWIRANIKNGDSIENIMNSYEKPLQQFSKTRKKYLIY
ncbi:exo-beta-N-acetylmuramidase NamZ domain-containing protein [Bacillus mexicanus]|uniref:exo-beta-N-acetylmuramidase NamZ family protein n=1 Tax=Bacillus mexicanus TaxID=2834415 RepID=UPI003D25380C